MDRIDKLMSECCAFIVEDFKVNVHLFDLARRLRQPSPVNTALTLFVCRHILVTCGFRSSRALDFVRKLGRRRLKPDCNFFAFHEPEVAGDEPTLDLLPFE